MNMTLPSPERVVLNTLEAMNHDKWGFVIYRCTYKDDQAWDRFKQIICESTRTIMQSSDAPEVANGLEWTFVEDRATLDGASRSQLRERFRQWAPQAIITEQPRDQARFNPNATFGVPRYHYFVQVDEQALESVLAAPEVDLQGAGFVNFVDSRWKPLGDRYYDDGDEPDDDEVLDPIDGCTEENVGWMRITAGTMANTEFYDAAADFAEGAWYAFYRRPPGVLVY
jgi:hypothetical protein